MLYNPFEKKEKNKEQTWKRKEREKKQAKKHVNSQLAQIKFLIEVILLVEQYFSYKLKLKSRNSQQFGDMMIFERLILKKN